MSFRDIYLKISQELVLEGVTVLEGQAEEVRSPGGICKHLLKQKHIHYCVIFIEIK